MPAIINIISKKHNTYHSLSKLPAGHFPNKPLKGVLQQ